MEGVGSMNVTTDDQVAIIGKQLIKSGGISSTSVHVHVIYMKF